MTSESRHFHLRAAVGKIRTAVYGNRAHLVMPVTALVEGVLHAVNSPIPELVLADEFGMSANSWNGRPVMMNHPEFRGQKISANDPRTLEKFCLGHVFNTRIEDSALNMDAWIDPVLARAVGEDGVRTLERLQAADPDDPLEVSVGVFMVAEAAKGMKNGKPYRAIWRHITPDHLAILSEGKVGACSVAMGCGIRHATVYLATAQGFKEVKETEMGLRSAAFVPFKKKDAPKLTPEEQKKLDAMSPEDKKKWLEKHKPAMKTASLWERIKTIATGREPTDTEIRAALSTTESDIDQRTELQEELKEVEPMAFGVTALYSDRVVYGVMTPGTGEITYYQRSYTGDESAGYTLGDTRTEVEQVMSFEPVSDDDDKVTAAEGCKCHSQEGALDMTKQDRIKALMAHRHNPLKDQKILEAASDDVLKTLEDHTAAIDATEKAAKDAADAIAKADAEIVALKAAASKELSEEEFLKTAPPSIRTMVQRHKDADARVHGALVTSLKTAQKVFTEDQLKLKTLEQLQEISSLIQGEPVDYSLRAVPRTAEAVLEYKSQPPPDGYKLALEARAAAKH